MVVTKAKTELEMLEEQKAAIEKRIEEIKSRNFTEGCLTHTVNDKLSDRVEYILKLEVGRQNKTIRTEYDEEQIIFFLDTLASDARKMMATLQSRVDSGEAKADNQRTLEDYSFDSSDTE